MYSRRTFEESGTYSITPPPGYDGSRFRRRRTEDDGNEAEPIQEKAPKKFSIGAEEILIVSLIIALASEDEISIELILMLALLLCV